MKKLGRIAAAFMASVFFVTGIPAMTAFAADGYSTTLANGEYTTDDFTFAWEGGTGKAHLELNKIIVTDGQAQGVFTASSEYMTHVYYLGHTSSEVDDPNYYDPSTDTCQNGVVPISGKQVSFPVALNEKTAIACRTTRMEEPHWVQYYYTITIDESLVTDADYTAVDAAIASVPTDLSIYTDESATAVTTAVNAVVRNLPASRQEEVDAMAAAITAAINGLELKSAEGKALHFIIVPDEQDESKNIEDPTNYSINLGAELVFEIIFSSMPSADFETTLNNQLSGLFTKTGGKGWQNEDGTVTGFYRYKAVATGEVTLPLNDNYSVVLTVADSEEPDDSQIELTIENKTGMFKADTATLETVDGQKTLVVALSGTGYHELFKGTYEQAVANGANTDNWVHGEINAEGKWEFRIPVADNENYIPIVAISDSYYNKYLNGQNTLERAFYPRQMDLDVEAKTLVTDDYHSSKEITVTNNVSKFKVNTPAVLNTVGGPNSNNYKSDLVLTMGSNSYDQVFVGTYAEANEATKTIQLAEDNSFAIPVKWVETFGDPTTLKTLTDGQQFAISFRSASKQTWYERLAKLDEEAGTLIFDPSTADYSVVDAAKAKVPADLSIYTEETAKAVTDAVDAVETGKFASQQEEVDAMAKAIEDAIAALKTKPGVLKVVNNVKMFSPVSATLDSNDGKEIVNLTMKSESFDKIFLGKANAVDDSKTIALDNKVFTFEVAELETEFPVAFHSTTSGWYNRLVTVSKENGTITFNDEKADYTAVEAAKAKAAALDESLYTPDSYKAVTDAVAAVKENQNSAFQSQVDAMAQAIEDAIAALKLLADYSIVDEAKATAAALNRDLYTAESLAAVDVAVAAVVEGKSVDEQEAVDAMAKAIEDAIAALKLKPADYSAVDNALGKAEKLDKSIYTPESLAKVEEAVATVERGKMIDEQEAVDAMAKAIEDALSALDYKSFTITWKNEDGTVLATDEVKYGQTPSYSGTTPEKAATEEVFYTFKDWTPAVSSVKGDATYTATFTETKIEYKFESESAEKMNWEVGSNKPFDFTVHRTYQDGKTIDHFVSIEVDGKVLDPANYTAVSGSLKASLKADYMATLSEGKHTLKVNFDDGSVETTFTVAKKATDNKSASDNNAAKTGDNNNMMLWIIIMALALAAGTASVILVRRKTNNR